MGADLHETHVCRDCGAEITIPYVHPPYPLPEDFEAMSYDEFEAYIKRIGFDERIKRAMAESDRRRVKPTAPRTLAETAHVWIASILEQIRAIVLDEPREPRPRQHFCTGCGALLERVCSGYHFDEQTGERIDHYWWRCPNDPYRNSSSITSAHDQSYDA